MSTYSNGSSFGGLVGQLFGFDSLITDSSSTAAVNGYTNTGGLVGYLKDGRIYNSYAAGTVTGNAGVGGFVGDSRGVISNSYATGDVSVTEGSSGGSVGGFVGVLFDDKISNSYATGDVNGYEKVGGFAGSVYGQEISNSYSTGTVTGTSAVGGFAGLIDNDGVEISSSFWDKTASGVSSGVGSNNTTSVVDVKGLTTAQMSQSSNFTNAGWSEDYWDFSTGAAPDVKKIDLETNPAAGYMEIHTVDDLKNISTSGHFVLMNDLDLTGIDWTPIGFKENDDGWSGICGDDFAGVLDGNGHKITGLTLTGDEDHQGLFYRLANAEVKNLEFVDASVHDTTGTQIGLLAADAYNTKISNIKVTNASIEADSGYVGTIIGGTGGYGCSYMTITDIEITGLSITGENLTVGGIASSLHGSVVKNVSVQGSIASGGTVGGIVGQINNTEVNQAAVNIDFTLKNVSSYTYDNYFGGVAGYAIDSVITNSSVIGSQRNDDGAAWFDLGGIAGQSEGSTITNNYTSVACWWLYDDEWQQAGAPGSVNTSGMRSPIVYNDRGSSTITNNYWDKAQADTDDDDDGVGQRYLEYGSPPESNISGNAGLTTSELADSSNFAGWDLSLWDFSSGKPVLKYDMQPVAETPDTPETETGTTGGTTQSAGFITEVQQLTEEEAIAQGYTVIKTADELNNIRNDLDGKYILMGNIDLSSYSNWEPLGTSGSGFTGEFNGNGFVISNLTVDGADVSYAGLFGKAVGAAFKNLGLENVNIKGDDYAGGLVGRSNGDVSIENCYVTGTVTSINSHGFAGGLVGYGQRNTVILNCYSTADVTANVTANGSAGGIVGGCNGQVENSYATGNVTGGYAGGLVGALYYSGQNNPGEEDTLQALIKNSYATGNVTGGYTGGLTGYGAYDTLVQSSYATGTVSGTTQAGGLVGLSDSDFILENSRWNTLTTGQTAAIGDNEGTSTNNQGLTTSQFADKSNFSGWSEDVWDFSGPAPTIKLNPSTSAGTGGTGSTGSTDGSGSTLTGSVDTDDFTGAAFWGQKDGEITFSDGTVVQIGANDNIQTVIDKINEAGLYAEIDEEGFITIISAKTSDLSITSDTTGFGGVYGLMSTQTVYDGSVTTNLQESSSISVSSVLTGSVSTKDFTDAAFWGQKTGTITFSNGVSVNIDAGDTRSEVLAKINAAGMSAVIDPDGFITITADGTSNLSVTSDNTGFSDFYGLAAEDVKYDGDIVASYEQYQTGPGTTLMQGQASSLNENIVVLGGSIKVGDAAEIDAAGKTLKQIVDAINALGLEGVSASISDGKFTVTSEAGEIEIVAKGDFARVTGMDRYTINAADISQTGSSGSTGGTEGTEGTGILTEAEAIAQGYTIIKTADELNNIRNNLSGKYILMGNIDLSSYDSWEAIGGESNAFSGVLNGNGYKITGLTINDTGYTEYVGLFGYTDGAEISDLIIEDATIDGYRSLGILAGRADDTVITNVHTSGSVTANKSDGVSYGGLVGYAYGSNTVITNSSSSADVTGYIYTGGLVGCLVKGTVSNSFATGDVTGYSYNVGGFVGYSYWNSVIESSYATGNVTGTGADAVQIGGFAGNLSDYTAVSDCYSTGNVSANGVVGGFTGVLAGASITNSYANGSVSSETDTAGGFIGQIQKYTSSDTPSTVTNSFFNKENAGTSTAVGENLSATSTISANGMTTTQMSQSSTFTNAGWSEDIWDFPGDVPKLKWQTQSTTGSGSSESASESLGTFISEVEPLSEAEALAAGYTIINSVEDLKNINDNLSGKYILMGNIDLSGINWTPLGYFKGEFNGNGYKISNLNIDKADTNYVGLFSESYGATFKNVFLENVNIKGGDYTGGIVGNGGDATISNCFVTGTISGYSCVGGLAGGSSSLTLENSYSEVDVTAAGINAGSLIGYIGGGNIENCYATGDVTGNGYTGGLIGSLNPGTDNYSINNCYATGTVTSTDGRAGGFAGCLNGVAVTNSWASGDVYGAGEDIGGFVGYSGQFPSTDFILFDSCYAKGNVVVTDSSSSYIGGFAGETEGGLTTNCYSAGNVSAAGCLNTGGFVGSLASVTENSYAIGSVTGGENAGGFAGEVYQNAKDFSITNCYALGDVSGTYYVGGFIGNYDDVGSEISDCYSLGKNISGTKYVGGLIGQFMGQTIDNCYATGNVEGTDQIGGLVGNLWNGNVSNSYAKGNVTATGISVGGLIGDTHQDNQISYSYSTGNVSGLAGVGGLIGATGKDTVVTKSYTTANTISGTENNVGGLIGQSSSITMSDCYAINETISGEYNVGGFIGSAITISPSTISNSYAVTNTIISEQPDKIGSLIGFTYEELVLSNCKWNKELSELSAISNDSDPITMNNTNGLTTSQFASGSNFSGWDTNTWDFSGNTPILKNMPIEETHPGSSGGVDPGTGSTGGTEGSGSTEGGGSSGGDTLSTVITGSVSTTGMADHSFWGQKDGVLTFSDGTTVNISATDTRSQVIEKINAAGYTAEIDENGKITITKEGEFTITSDTSGFATFYGLTSSSISYGGNVVVTEGGGSSSGVDVYTSIITGGVDVSGFVDAAFWGQKDGTLVLSNGVSINISATDTRSDVLAKFNAISGVTASVNAQGRIQISVENAQNITVKSDSSGFADFYGLSTTGGSYSGSISTETIQNDNAQSTLKGSVDTTELTGEAFWGQATGTIEFSNGASVSINANDDLDTVIQKINNAGLEAQIGSDGKITITAKGVEELQVTSDSTGFTDFYGLKLRDVFYSGHTTQNTVIENAGTDTSSTLTGSVDTREFTGDAFWGQQSGTITFSNGISVNISASDTLAQVLQKINDAGFNASVNSEGRIEITADGTLNLSIVSDNTGFSEIYGLGTTPVYDDGFITITTDTIDGPQGNASSSTITGAVDTREFEDSPFWGQKDGLLTFTNGVSVQISATDRVSDVIQKLNDAGLLASVNSEGRITITAENTNGLNVVSDTSGFADFYGFSVYGGAYAGSITKTEVVSPVATFTTYSVVNSGNPVTTGDTEGQTFSRLTGSNNVSYTTQILESVVTISYKNDAGVDVSKTFTLNAGTLQSAIETINGENWYVKAQINEDGKFELVSRAAGPFDISIKMEKENGIAGDFGRVVGMATQTTLDGSGSQQRKDAATITGGTSGLTLSDQILGENSITIWMTRERPGFTGVDTMTGTGDLASVQQTITFTDRDNDGKITIAEAIEQINEKASITKVKASLVDGQFVLTQIDDRNAEDRALYNTAGGANTAGEGDTIKYSITGTGDFEQITGLASYSVSASASTGVSGTDNGYHYHSVVETTVKTGGTIKSGSINIGGTEISVSGLTVQEVVNKINSSYSDVANAALNGNKLIIMTKPEYASSSSAESEAESITATGDAARVLGLADYSVAAGGSSSGVYRNHYEYTYDVWSQKTDDWDTTKDHGGSDNYSVETSVLYNTTYEYRYQDEIWEDRTLDLTTTIADFSGEQYRSQVFTTSIETNVVTNGGATETNYTTWYSGTYQERTQEEAWTTKETGYGVEITDDETKIRNQSVQSQTMYKETYWSKDYTTTYSTEIMDGFYEDPGFKYTVGLQYRNVSSQHVIDQIRDGIISLSGTYDMSNYNTSFAGQSGGTITINSSYFGTLGTISYSSTTSISSILSSIGNSKGISYVENDGSVIVTDGYYGKITLSDSGNALKLLGLSGTDNCVINSGTITIDRHKFDAKGKTLKEVINEINASGLAEAKIENGKFTVYSKYSVGVSGDLARVTGFGDYTVGAASTSTTNHNVTYWKGEYLTDEQLASGYKFGGGVITIKVSSAIDIENETINVAAGGKTLQQIVDEINASAYNVEAEIMSDSTGKFLAIKNINSTTSSSVTATGEVKEIFSSPNLVSSSEKVSISQIQSSINMNDFAGYAYIGQKSGSITIGSYSYSVSSSDDIETIINKINQKRSETGVYAFISGGKVTIKKLNSSGLKVSGDSSGVAAYYGLTSSSTTYKGKTTSDSIVRGTYYITGSVDTSGYVDRAFIGQKSGVIKFSNGVSINVSDTDSLSVVTAKMSAAGLTVSTTTDGKIKISTDTNGDASSFRIVSDTSGFSSFYGLAGATTLGSVSLSGDDVVIGGTLTIGSRVIDTKGKSIDAIIAEINGLGVDGLSATLSSGKIVITGASGISATGDFGRVSGLGTYSVGAATYETILPATVYVTSGATMELAISGSASRNEKYDTDWNGITQNTATLTGSITDLYDDFSFALQEGGSFDLYLGDRLLKTVTYSAGSSIDYILNQISGTYVYNTGKKVSSPFPNGTDSDEIAGLSGNAYTDGSGNICYTASFSASLDSQGRIVITSDVFDTGTRTLTVKNDTGNFTKLAGLASVGSSYSENNANMMESYGYDRLTGSVENLTAGHSLGNLTSETFQISGGNGTFNVSVSSTDTIQSIINKVSAQTNGAYKAGLDEQGRFYIESTIQTPTDTQVTSTDLTRRLGLVAVDKSTGASSQTETGDHGYFIYESNGGGVYGMKPNSIFTGLKDGQLTFTLHAKEATGETGSITYRPDITYTIDIVYNDTVSSVLNKMKQAILAGEDDIWEHDDVIDENRADRIDFKVNYDENTNLGKIYLQIIGNYASGITFDI